MTTLGPAVGSTLGPIMGGYIVERLEWRWIFWIGIMLLAVTWAPAVFILKETFPPVLQARAARKGNIESLASQPTHQGPIKSEKLGVSEAVVATPDRTPRFQEVDKPTPPALSFKNHGLVH